MKNLITWAGVAILFVIPVVAQQSNTPSQQSPQDSSAMEQRIKDLEERIIALEGQVRMLKAAPAAAPAQPLPAPGETTAQPQVGATVPAQAPVSAEAVPGALPVYGGASASAKALNPDISVIGDFIGKAGGNSVQPTPSLEMHESEIGLQAIIDPYARGDFFISFGESGVNLEEGYITFTALPAGIVAKVGKMRSAFGKVNMMHNHVLPWVDRPLVTNNLVPAFLFRASFRLPKAYSLRRLVRSFAEIPAPMTARYFTPRVTVTSAPSLTCAATQISANQPT